MHDVVRRTALPGRSQSSYDRLARGLGYFSIALGVAELVAPRAICRAAGLKDLEPVIRGYGAREIATGVAILGSILNNAYQSNLGPHLPALPGVWRTAALGSIAGASNVGRGIGGPVGGAVIRAANEAYTQGMGEVMLVSAALVLATAIAVAVFLPARVSPMDAEEA